MIASVVLVNPTRVANAIQLRQVIAKTLSGEGWLPPIWVTTTPTDSGERGTRAAVDSGARIVFVCGGDGTVSAAALAAAGSEAALALIPSGTGNLLALNLGVPTEVGAATRLAVRGGRRSIDLGEVDGRLFTVAAGIGLDAQMLADTPHRAKHHLGWSAYAASILRHLGDPRFSAQISLDGAPPIIRDVRSVLVANVGRLPGGINLLPEALPDDGLLDVALIAPRRLLDWAGLLASLIGRNPKGGRLETFQAHRVEVTTEQPQPREIDGESLPAGCELTVSVRPGALTVCVPAPDSVGNPRK